MQRITVGSRFLVGALVALVALPAAASAGGCEVLGDPRDRAECTARQAARDAAREEVQRQVDGARPGGARSAGDAPAQSHSAAWEQALEDADGVDAGALLEPRLLAAVGGLAWFLLALRARRRSRSRA